MVSKYSLEEVSYLFKELELFILQRWYLFTEKLVLSKISDNNQ